MYSVQYKVIEKEDKEDKEKKKKDKKKKKENVINKKHPFVVCN